MRPIRTVRATVECISLPREHSEKFTFCYIIFFLSFCTSKHASPSTQPRTPRTHTDTYQLFPVPGRMRHLHHIQNNQKYPLVAFLVTREQAMSIICGRSDHISCDGRRRAHRSHYRSAISACQGARRQLLQFSRGLYFEVNTANLAFTPEVICIISVNKICITLNTVI